MSKTIRAVICRCLWVEHDPPLVLNGVEYEASAEVDKPVVQGIVPTLEVLQQLVGGDIEWRLIGPDVGLYCNEDGIALGLAPNRCALLGDFVVVGSRGGDERSLTDEELRKVLAWCARGAGQIHPHLLGEDCGPTVEFFDSFEKMQAKLDAVRRARDDQWAAL